MIAHGHSLRRNVFYALLGNGALHVARFVVLVLLAKLTRREVVGSYSYANIALAAPIVLFFGLELRVAFVADAGGEFAFGVYRKLRAIGMGVSAVVLAAAVLWVTRSAESIALIWLMLAVCADRIALHLAEVDFGLYQRRERLDLLAWSNGLRGLTMLACFAVPLLWVRAADGTSAWTADTARLTQAAAWGASAQVVAWLAIWWLFDRRRVVGRPDVDLSWTWAALGRLARQTLPLGLVFLLINLCETVVQWFVKRAAGGDGWAELGSFGAMRYVTLAATFLIVQVNQAASNRLANYYQQDLRSFLRLALKITAVAVLIGAGMLLATWLLGAWFLRVVYTPEYAAHAREFVILMLAQAIVLLVAVFGSVTTQMRQFWIQVPVQLTVLGVTAGAAALLVQPANPVLGGAWTMLARSLTQVVLYLGCVALGIRWRERILAVRGGGPAFIGAAATRSAGTDPASAGSA